MNGQVKQRVGSPTRGQFTGPRLRPSYLLFVLPAVLWYAVFMLWPLVNMLQTSTLDWNGMLRPSSPVGLGNYAKLPDDPYFTAAVVNSLVYVLVSVPGVVTLAFLLGYFLSRRPPGYRVMTVIFFVPAMFSVAGTAMMFLGVYSPDGVLNASLRAIGLGGLATNWIATRQTALASVIAVDFWSGIGLYAVMFAAALSDVPEELYESARLEGAGHLTQIRHIAAPLASEFIGVVVMLHFLWVLIGSAQTVLLLTKGGPGTYSLTLGYYVYERAFVGGRIGYSQAVAVILALMGIVALAVIRFGSRRKYPA